VILPELVKAVQRLDEKINTIADCLGPLAADIQYVKMGARFDQELLRQIVSRSLKFSTDTLVEEAKIKYVDGVSALANKKGQKDPTTLAMAEARKSLANFTSSNLKTEIQGKLANEVANILAKVNAEVKRQLKIETDKAMSLMNKAIRVGSVAEQKAEEAKRMVEEDVNNKIKEVHTEIKNGLGTFVDGPLCAIKEDNIRRIDAVKKLAEEGVLSVKDSLKELKELVVTVDKNMEAIGDMVTSHRRDLDASVTAAKSEMSKDNDIFRERIEKQLVTSGEQATEFLHKANAKTSEILATAQTNIDSLMNDSARDIEEKTLLLQSKYDDLKSLASRTEAAIIEVEKTTASVGNSTPRNLRHKIRISNV
jgi:hypothetical protein